MESYKGNQVDPSSSMAYFYSIDTTGNKKIKEQIVSYDKEFVEVQEYQYNQEGQLEKIIVSHENAVDEIVIESTVYKNEKTKTYFENGIVQKSIRESTAKDRTRGEVKVVLTKTYLDGEPNRAVEEMKNEKGLLISKEVFQYDIGAKKFVAVEKHNFEYDKEGNLSKEVIGQGNATSVKEFVFQFDDNEQKNWVKKIITPENTFTTRRITYYPSPDEEIDNPQ